MCVGPGTGPGDGTGVNSILHRAAVLAVPSSGLYLALSSSGSDFHIWPKVHSRCELRKLRGRSGRCSWQKTVSDTAARGEHRISRSADRWVPSLNAVSYMSLSTSWHVARQPTERALASWSMRNWWHGEAA